MGKRITDLGSEEFGRLFTGFEHTAYRLETLQQYEVGYEADSFAAFLAGRPVPHDPARDAWTSIVRDAVAAGKVFQRVHVVREPLTGYLRYEMERWYEANTQAGDDTRILVAAPGEWPGGLPDWDYWLFDSREAWAMAYSEDGQFRYAEQIEDPAVIVQCNYWRDAALHLAVPYRDYKRGRALQRAS